MATKWNPSKATYQTAKGKEIPYESVRGSIEKVAADTSAKLRNLTQQFVDKKIDLPSWSTQSEALIRKSLISSGQIAAGGKAQLSASLNGKLGSIVKFHLGKFRDMGLARERGEVSDAQLLARADMYADATVGTYEQIHHKVKSDAGYKQVKNILGSGESCSECLAITALGYMPTAKFKPPGTRKCMSRCKCGSHYK